MREPRPQCASDYSALRESVRDFEPSIYAAESQSSPSPKLGGAFVLNCANRRERKGRRRAPIRLQFASREANGPKPADCSSPIRYPAIRLWLAGIECDLMN